MILMEKTNTFTQTQAYAEMHSAFASIQDTPIRDLFARDPQRFEHYRIQWEAWLFDPSKNKMDARVFQAMQQLAEEMQLSAWFRRMLQGDILNQTEKRAVLHTALRNFSGSPVMVDGKNVMPDVQAVLVKMRRFSTDVISGVLTGYTGKRFTDVVNIGIGGSDLGPVMVCEALKHYHVPGLRVHFVSNVDGSHITETLKRLDPETTLFLIASKTFTTQETMANARSARAWLVEALGQDAAVAKHFIALSTAQKEVEAFGIHPENMFAFWDWVGGRYSLWSAIGLSICLAVGYSHFEDLLRGAHAVDRLTEHEPFERNIPMQMAMLGVWYGHFFGYHTHAVIPYDQYLHRFTAYLQQADMESNGKSVHRDGTRVQHPTGPVVWGEPGTNGQHAFFQLMHQGTEIIPADFIVAAKPLHALPDHHEMLLSNCLAQTEALMTGKSADAVRTELLGRGMTPEEVEWHTPFRVFEGDRPTTTLVMDQLTPYNLGMLIAMYEHKIFFQGILWNVFSFDQWGVELGKKLAAVILPEIMGQQDVHAHDGGTNGLINHVRAVRKQ